MTYQFPGDGDEWIQEYARLLEESEEYSETGAGGGTDFDGDFLFVVEPDNADDGEPVYFSLGLEDGDCTAAHEVDDEEYGFVFRGLYSNRKKHFAGELGPSSA